MQAALLGANVATLLTASPPALVLAIAGIALLSTIMNSLAASVERRSDKTAVSVTFLTAASGIRFGGIGAACLGRL